MLYLCVMATRSSHSVRVARWGNSLAVRIPASIVKACALKEGDAVTLTDGEGASMHCMTREERLARLQALTRFSDRIPPDFKFDREEANAR